MALSPAFFERRDDFFPTVNKMKSEHELWKASTGFIQIFWIDETTLHELMI